MIGIKGQIRKTKQIYLLDGEVPEKISFFYLPPSGALNISRAFIYRHRSNLNRVVGEAYAYRSAVPYLTPSQVTFIPYAHLPHNLFFFSSFF